MHIHGTTHIHGPHGVNAPHTTHRSQASHQAQAGQAVDRVDISAAAEAASRAAETGPIRFDLVNEIRSQIAAGTYDTDAKLEDALQRMFDEIG